MWSELLPREGHGTLNQGSSRGLGFPKCKRKSCTWLQDRYGAQIPAEIHNYTVVCSRPPVKQLPPQLDRSTLIFPRIRQGPGARLLAKLKPALDKVVSF